MRRMTRWSRRSIKPQTWRATVMAFSRQAVALRLPLPLLRSPRRRYFAATTSNALSARADIPQHARSGGAVRKMFLPFAAEPDFLEPVRRGERRHQHGKRQHGQRGRLLLKHCSPDAVNVGGELGVGALQ